ncbi:MAG: hypothetical protein AB1467_06685 [Candidatus Diapherotrites archaeon]
MNFVIQLSFWELISLLVAYFVLKVLYKLIEVYVLLSAQSLALKKLNKQEQKKEDEVFNDENY